MHPPSLFLNAYGSSFLLCSIYNGSRAFTLFTAFNLLQSTDQLVDYLPNLTDLLYGLNISIVSTEIVVLYLHYPQESQVLCRFLEDLFIHLSLD